MRTDLKVRRILETVGYSSLLIGMIGMAGAIEKGNGFLISAILLSIGIGTSLFFMNK